MAIMGNVVGNGASPLKTLILEDPTSGLEIWGTVVDNEQVLDAKPSDVRIGKKVVTDSGVIEGTAVIYRTTVSSCVILPGEQLSIPLNVNDKYDYTKFQCIVVVYSSDYSNNVVTKYVSINNNVFSIATSEKVSSITKNSTTKSIDLNLTNDSQDIYEIFYATYKQED